MNRRHALASLAAVVASLRLEQTQAQTQVISNSGQIVSTDDVYVRQAAGGQQMVYNSSEGVWQAISNDLQVVSTGSVVVDQTASGSQVVENASTFTCTPGDYVTNQNGCIDFCSLDCEWIMFCCNNKNRCKKDGR